MTGTQNILIITMIFGIWLTPLGAQASQTGELPGRAMLSKQDIDIFEPLLAAYLNAAPGEPEKKAEAEFLRAMKDFSMRNGNSSPVADCKAWLSMFSRHKAASFIKKQDCQAGQVVITGVAITVKYEHCYFEYSVYLPKNYDPSRSWPVLLCLHNFAAEALGKGYIEKTWLGDKKSEELCERFILIAPHLPEKIPRRRVQVTLEGKKFKTRSSAKRLSWFDSFYLLAIVNPLNKLRENYNCDPKRIFVEGVGDGADAALALAAMSPGRFAGVIARHGQLRDHRLFSGLQYTPTIFAIREDSQFASGDGREFLNIVRAAQVGETQYDDLLIEVVGKQVDSEIRTLSGSANQDLDRVVEANERVAAFVLEHTLNPNPEHIRIVSSNRIFRSHPRIKVTSHNMNEGRILDCQAKFDRERNSVELRGKNFYGVSLFLSDFMLDLDRPIKVLVNGQQVANRIVDRSPLRMIKAFKRSRGDSHFLHTALMVVPEFELRKEDVVESRDGDQDHVEQTISSGILILFGTVSSLIAMAIFWRLLGSKRARR